MGTKRIERQLQGELLAILKNLLPKRGFKDISAVQEEERSDIQLRRGLKVILSLELKDPRNPEGKTVFHPKTYRRELERANRIGADIFAISNFREIAFFNLTDREKDSYEEFASEKEIFLELDRYSKTLRLSKRLKELLKRIAENVLDYVSKHLKGELVGKNLDERFIFRVKSFISAYAYGLADRVQELYEYDIEFRKRVNNWFIKQQWTIPTDYEDFLKLSHLSLLMLVAKLIFYKAVYDSKLFKLPKLVIPEHIKAAKDLKTYLFSEYFKVLIKETGDYGNLIGLRGNLLNVVPFLDDEIVSFVRDLVETEEEYDFSKIDYDVVGRIFEELIKEEERHKFGQYFTPAEVIDLINAFCIRTGNEKVLDPTCGAGTFLVRIYQRKKRLTNKTHAELLREIYGIDISPYAVELAILNLAIRDLRYPKAHPKVFLTDFFKVKPKGECSNFDSIVGNPPYTRQEEIDDLLPQQKAKIEKALKEDYGSNFEPSKRSSLYAYVFYHSGVFLKEGGYLGFITSNSYLDTDYGKDLQKWFLDNFRIVAIIDSKVERFFPSADVNTCITILQKEKDRDKRNSNLVRFVYLKKPLNEVLKAYLGEDKLREFIENTNEYYEDEFLKINPIKQENLYETDKWSVFLKAGKVYWDILSRGEWTTLGEIAKVRRGFTTGDNKFFYVEDITDKVQSLKEIPVRNLTEDIETLEDIRDKGLRIVKNGYNEVWLIEEELLRDVVKSPQELSGYFVNPKELKYKVLYFGGRKKHFKTLEEYEEFVANHYPYAWEYIKWGEKKGISEKNTCKSRKPWWDLGEWEVADILWIKSPYDRFFSIRNESKTLIDQRLYGCANLVNPNKYFLFINSFIEAFIYFTQSRSSLGEGATELTVEEVKQFPVPQNLNLSNSEIQKLVNLLKNAKVSSIFEEIGTYNPQNVDLNRVKPHRLELDLAILKALGFENPKEILKELYSELIDLVISRIERAKSVAKVKKKRLKREIEEYLNRLEEITKNLQPERNYDFAKQLEKIIKLEITPDKKLANKILNAYWRKIFGEKLELKRLKEEKLPKQKKLF